MTLHCPKGHPVEALADIGRFHCPVCRVAYLPNQVHEQAELFPAPKLEPRPPAHGIFHLGIDPGAHTGLALLDSAGEVIGTWSVVWRDHQDSRGGYQLELAIAEIALLVGGRHAIRGTAERPVAARKGQASVKSWVGMGAYLGRVEQAVWRILGEYPGRVEVKDWRESMGLRAACTKDESIAAATALPGEHGELDHNEAEAVLIAEAGRRMG